MALRLPGQQEGESAQQPEHDRHSERQTCQPRERPAQPLDIELHPGQEQQHAKTKIAEDLHWRVHTYPAKN